MTRWLDDDEQRAWLRLAGVMLKLSPALDSQLQRDSDLTHFDYLCLAMLSGGEEHTLRMSELADRTNATLSRLSHVVSKLEARGWVQRRPSPDSRRVTLVTLTGPGWEVLHAAAPSHAETVRSLVFDGLSREDVAALERIAGHIVDRLDAGG
jgi:DNA-binding MarR family transcriptional regulator